MNIFVQYVQQDVGLRVRIIPVGYLVEKLGMAFRDVGVIPLLALYKFQIGKTEIGKRFQVILDICPRRTNHINVDGQTMGRLSEYEHQCRSALENQGQPARPTFQAATMRGLLFHQVLVIECNADETCPIHSVVKHSFFIIVYSNYSGWTIILPSPSVCRHT